MDRDTNWDRIEKAYNLMTLGEAEHRAPTAVAGLEAAYERGEDDEFVASTIIADDNEAPVTIDDGDAVLFMNFRADRARQITHAFVDKGFDGFSRRKEPKLADFVMLTEYESNIDTSCAYPPESLPNMLGEYVSNQGKQQLRIAETEKYAHVTFFFNGGREEPFPGEDRILVPSPKVATYDLKPEMSAPEVTDRLVEAINSGKLRHGDLQLRQRRHGRPPGSLEAAMKAAEAVDESVGRVLEAL